jgi:hypothetical protein
MHILRLIIILIKVRRYPCTGHGGPPKYSVSHYLTTFFLLVFSLSLSTNKFITSICDDGERQSSKHSLLTL